MKKIINQAHPKPFNIIGKRAFRKPYFVCIQSQVLCPYINRVLRER